jgi:NAD+ synthase (glutamine-hydrolysing)
VTLRVALAQINPTVGDLVGNTELILAAAAQAHADQADVLLTPELALTGYPIEDLALRPSFQEAVRATVTSLTESLADRGFGDLVVIVGTLDHREDRDDPRQGQPRRAPVNAAAVLFDGRVHGRYHKHHLPNYGVFDEARYFIAGDTPLFLDLPAGRLALAICEDLWQDGGPVQWARDAHADALLVLNASPYERSKDDARLALCQARAQQADCPLLYVNLIGGQDELVFDGDSLVVAADGTLRARAPQFISAQITVDLALTGQTPPPSAHAIALPVPSRTRTELSAPTIAPELSDEEETYRALTLGLADYVHKNGFTSVLLGLSGGIDSALVAAIACDAVGAEHVFGVAMPSEYSSEHSVTDAYDLAERAGLSIRTVPIEPMVRAFHTQLELTGLAAENLQARVRGTTLMALSNQEGHLVLATGNKSELSVGYSTIYGDAVGGFAPIKDVPKTQVWALARWRNEQSSPGPIPPNSIEKPPSAELRPDQLDTDSLPDYELLDDLLDAYVHADQGADTLIAAGYDAELVHRVIALTDAAEYKRRQYPPGTKISLRAFGRDRRLPITNRWRER